MLTKLYFLPPSTNEDGSALLPADIFGYEVRVDGGSPVSLSGGEPQQDGRLLFPISQLSLPSGSHSIEVRTAHKAGSFSIWSSVLTVLQVVLPNPPSLLSAE